MSGNKSLLNDGKGFFLPYLFLLVAGLYPLLAFSARESILWVNRLNHPFGDYFFYFITIAGDEIVAVAIIAILFFISYRAAIILLFAVLLAVGMVHLFKEVLFSNSHRPFKVIQDIPDLHIIPFVQNYPNNSFPSGHTALAFTLYAFLALWFRNRFISVLLLIIAVLVAYSRMYLFQHFFVDIYVGSIFGVLSTSFAMWLFFYKENALLANKDWADKSLLKL